MKSTFICKLSNLRFRLCFRIMPDKNIVEDVIGDLVDNFTETVQKNKHGSSFFEQEDSVSSRFNRLFDRQKPIHHVLGGGKCKNSYTGT